MSSICSGVSTVLPRNAGATRFRDEPAHQPHGVLRPFFRTPAGRELAHKCPRAVPDFHEPLRLKLAVRLNDGRGIDTELSGELANGRERRGAPEGARCNRQSHAFRDLCIQRNGTPRVDVVKQVLRPKIHCVATVKQLVGQRKLSRCLERAYRLGRSQLSTRLV